MSKKCLVCRSTIFRGSICPECGEGSTPLRVAEERDPLFPADTLVAEIEKETDELGNEDLIVSLWAQLKKTAREDLEALLQVRKVRLDALLPIKAEFDGDTACNCSEVVSKAAMADVLTRIIRRTKDAIKRFDAGEWGYCLQCHNRISIERLLLTPDAEFCMRCASGLSASARRAG